MDTTFSRSRSIRAAAIAYALGVPLTSDEDDDEG
jgi:hypothetical protein